MQRWETEEEPKHLPVDAVGVDPVRGGQANLGLCYRRGHWFSEINLIPGKKIKDGPTLVKALMTWLGSENPNEWQTKSLLKDKGWVNIDLIGVGSSGYDFLKKLRVNTYGVDSGSGSDATTLKGGLSYYNYRAQIFWQFREQLDPENGLDIAIPRDPELKQELTSIRWEMTVRGIKIEKKEGIIERLGRSVDSSDTLIYASLIPPATIPEQPGHKSTWDSSFKPLSRPQDGDKSRWRKF
jgi:hypothetical protein